MYLETIKHTVMKKLFIIICISLAIFACQEDDDTVVNENRVTYVGDVTLLTQQEVVDFGMLGYDAIDGFLEIGYNNFGGIDFPSDIVDLQPLSQINSVSGYLSISNNPNLNSLLGVHNINSVGDYLNLNYNNISDIGLNASLTIGAGFIFPEITICRVQIFFKM